MFSFSGEGEAVRLSCTYRFFHLDLIDFNSKELVLEIVVAEKLVSIFHVFALGGFGENSCLAARQGLECPPQFTVLWTHLKTIMIISLIYI